MRAHFVTQTVREHNLKTRGPEYAPKHGLSMLVTRDGPVNNDDNFNTAGCLLQGPNSIFIDH